MSGMMPNPVRRWVCYAHACLVDLIFPTTDPKDAPTLRLPWRQHVRRRRRVFPEDVPGRWVSDRELTLAERLARETGEAVPKVWRRLGKQSPYVTILIGLIHWDSALLWEERRCFHAT